MHRHLGALLITLSASAALPAQAYQLTPPQYYDLAVLPAWDNEGRLPEGHSKLSELEWIENDIATRTDRLKSRDSLIRRMEQQSGNTVAVRSLRADYEAQLESFARWQESMERRRKAIIDSADKNHASNRKAVYSRPVVGN